MHKVIALGALLGLIAFAFGEAAAVAVARGVIVAAIAAVALVAFDIATHGNVLH